MTYSETQISAIRHAVYSNLIGLLPVASYRQTIEFAANLSLCGSDGGYRTNAKERYRAIDKVLLRLNDLRVTPDIAEAGKAVSRLTIEKILDKKFGDRLHYVAGFHKPAGGKVWRMNLPEACSLFGYRSRYGYYNGILCQPVGQIDIYFLFSSAKFGGEKALRLEPMDKAFFDRYKEPAELEHNYAPTEIVPNMPGMRWTGRRFVEI